jgi:hypothetical protein
MRRWSRVERRWLRGGGRWLRGVDEMVEASSTTTMTGHRYACSGGVGQGLSKNMNAILS